MQRVILTYRKFDDGSQKRIFIRDGVVVNEAVENEIREGMENWTAVSIRRTGEPKRSFGKVAEAE